MDYCYWDKRPGVTVRVTLVKRGGVDLNDECVILYNGKEKTVPISDVVFGVSDTISAPVAPLEDDT